MPVTLYNTPIPYTNKVKILGVTYDIPYSNGYPVITDMSDTIRYPTLSGSFSVIQYPAG